MIFFYNSTVFCLKNKKQNKTIKLMPQFDFFSFFVQIFWLAFFSCIFYLIYLKMPLNNSSQVLKMRSKLKAFTSKANNKNKNNFIYNSAIAWFK